MSDNDRHGFDRREILKTSAMALGSALLAGEPLEAYPKGVNSNSNPSALKITDLRVATIVKPGPSPCPIIRIDTNQGVYGLGEVRDGASPTFALFLKSRILGENPLQIDRLFRKIKQFGGHARQGGGVCAIEMALWDIAGKVYNVPVYAMLGGKFRDKIRIYADTEESKDPKVYARRMKERKEGMGLTWLKMDLGVDYPDRKVHLHNRVCRLPGHPPVRRNSRFSTRHRHASYRSAPPDRSSAWLDLPSPRPSCLPGRNPHHWRSGRRPGRRPRVTSAQ